MIHKITTVILSDALYTDTFDYSLGIGGMGQQYIQLIFCFILIYLNKTIIKHMNLNPNSYYQTYTTATEAEQVEMIGR